MAEPHYPKSIDDDKEPAKPLFPKTPKEVKTVVVDLSSDAPDLRKPLCPSLPLDALS